MRRIWLHASLPILITTLTCLPSELKCQNQEPEIHEENWAALQSSGVALVKENHLDDALAVFRQSWKAAATDHQRAVSAGDIGVVLHALGGCDEEAIQWLERARKLLIASTPETDDLTRINLVISDIRHTAGDYRSAEMLLRESIAANRADPARLAPIQSALGDLLREQGRTTEAKDVFQQILRLPGLTPDLKQQALLGLADVERSRGAIEESIRQWRSASETARKEHDQVTEAIALRGEGSTWLDCGDVNQAEPLLRRSLQLLERNPSTPDEQKAVTLSALGVLYERENKLGMAEEALTRALKIERRLLGENHPRVAQLMGRLASVYADRGEFELARDLSSRAVIQMRSTFGDDGLPTASAMATAAYVEARAQHMDAAAQNYSDALRIARRHPDYQRLLLTLIERYHDVLKTLHRDREAAALDQEAKTLTKRLPAGRTP